MDTFFLVYIESGSIDSVSNMPFGLPVPIFGMVDSSC